MDENYLYDDIGDVITDGLSGEEKIVLLSKEGTDKDIRQSIMTKMGKKESEAITRYDSNKADDV